MRYETFLLTKRSCSTLARTLLVLWQYYRAAWCFWLLLKSCSREGPARMLPEWTSLHHSGWGICHLEVFRTLHNDCDSSQFCILRRLTLTHICVRLALPLASQSPAILCSSAPLVMPHYEIVYYFSTHFASTLEVIQSLMVCRAFSAQALGQPVYQSIAQQLR